MFSNITGTSVIWIQGANTTQVLSANAAEDYTYVSIDDITYIGVYPTPNCTASDFELKVEKLENALRDLLGDLVVAREMRAIE